MHCCRSYQALKDLDGRHFDGYLRLTFVRLLRDRRVPGKPAKIQERSEVGARELARHQSPQYRTRDVRAASTPSTVNRRDLDFQLFEVLQAETLTRRPAFADHDRTSFLAALDVAERIAADKFQPHYRESDLDEPRVENG